MTPSRFISRRLRFKGRLAAASIAVSFLVIGVALAVSAGFRREIRSCVTDLTGDVLLSGPAEPINAHPSYFDKLAACPGVQEIVPVVRVPGIVKGADDIHGVTVKGVPCTDTTALGVRIPAKLSRLLGIGVGDNLLTYFVSDKVKVRKFTVTSIYDAPVDADESLVMYASLQDMQRLNGWGPDEVSALEVRLPAGLSDAQLRSKAIELGSISLMYSADDEDSLYAKSAPDAYPQLFDWLGLIDFNVLAILLLMTVVAGFNMISGLLILLFRHVPTIGTLKALGMSDRGVSAVFLRVSARTVFFGMLAGNALSLLFCLLQGTTHFLKLNPANYFVSFVPVSVNFPLLVAVDVISFAVIMLLLLIPTLFISRVDPAEAVRLK